MKKLITVIAASLLLGSSVFAEGFINANDLTPGTIIGDQKEEDGFVLHGAPDASGKALLVENKSADPAICDGEKVTNRISMKGAGSLTERSISFPAKAGETITIFARSSNKKSARAIKVMNAEGVEIAELTGEVDQPDKNIKAMTVKVPANGTYTVFPIGGGAYFYMIKVAK